mgnify:CR=1 FL=1
MVYKVNILKSCRYLSIIFSNPVVEDYIQLCAIRLNTFWSIDLKFYSIIVNPAVFTIMIVIVTSNNPVRRLFSLIFPVCLFGTSLSNHCALVR